MDAERYEQQELLGSGAMGQVHKAWDKHLGRHVAVKTMLEIDNAEGLMRFHREARALGLVRHPHVVQVVEYSGPDANPPWLVLELLEGAPLSKFIAITLFPPDAAACVAAQLGEGIQAVHAAGLLHRDVKPENVFLEEDGRTVLGDFGIVRGTRGSGTFVRTSTQAIGSPAFASPEQIYRPDDAGPASDVFSFGATVHALLSGNSPFYANTVSEILSRVSKGDADPLPDSVPQPLAHLVMRMIAPKPEDRPTIPAVLSELNAFLSARGVIDRRLTLRRFMGVDDSERTRTGHTGLFDSATRVAKVLPASSPTMLPSPTAKPKTAARWPWVAFAGSLVIATLSLWFVLRPKPLPPAPIVERVTIDPIDPGALPQPEAPPIVPSEIKEAPKVRLPKPEGTQEAVLQIVTKPWAKVFIDDEPVGTTPVFRVTQVPSGKHRLRFENPGFKSKQMQIDVRPGERKVLTVELDR